MGHADISTAVKFYVHERRDDSDEMRRLDLGLPLVIAIVRRDGEAV